MKPEAQIKKLNKELKEVQGKLNESTMEVLDKNIEIAKLERTLFIALSFLNSKGKP